jgi:hypothetical protein
MRICNLLCAGAVSAIISATASAASAQSFESVGVRAQGLGGAFVAVADDATASWWNPAGLASGAYLSAVLEHGQTTEPVNPPAAGPAMRTTPSAFAVAFPSLGLSYYRLRISEIAPPASTGGSSADRQDPGSSASSVRSVALTQYGATMGQSIGDFVVIGSTVKVMRAGAVRAAAADAAPLDAAADLDVPQHTRLDFDLGVLARFRHLRVGGAIRNFTSPTFGDGADAVTLRRQARVGLAWVSEATGGPRGVRVAGDADLTTRSTVVGDVRHVAGGIEMWLARGRAGVRGGVSGNTIGAARPAVSGGLTLGLTRAIQVNASRTVGRDDSVTGWGTSVSVTF